MSLVVSCPCCAHPVGVVKGLSQEICPRCGHGLGIAPDESPTADWPVPSELQESWEDPDIVEE